MEKGTKENKETNKGKENGNRGLKCLFNFICEILFKTLFYTTVSRWQGYNICFVSVAGFMREIFFLLLRDRKGNKPKKSWIPWLFSYRLFALFVT